MPTPPGVITAVQAEVGQVLAQGQGMVKLARTDELEILVGVPEHRLKAVREREPHDLRAVVRRRPRLSPPGCASSRPAPIPMTRTYPARFSVVDAPPFIGIGMTASLTLVERPDPSRSPRCR